MRTFFIAHNYLAIHIFQYTVSSLIIWYIFEQLISSLQISTSCTHRVIVHYCQLTVTPLSSLVLLNLTCLQAQVMLHYQYLPWHIITAAIKCSMCWICIREIILPLLEWRCSINRDQIIRELTVAITWLNFNSKNIQNLMLCYNIV